MFKEIEKEISRLKLGKSGSRLRQLVKRAEKQYVNVVDLPDYVNDLIDLAKVNSMTFDMFFDLIQPSATGHIVTTSFNENTDKSVDNLIQYSANWFDNCGSDRDKLFQAWEHPKLVSVFGG